MYALSKLIDWLRNRNVFIIIPILLLIYVLASGSGTLMEKFGFKTKETYRVLYVESQKNLQLAREELKQTRSALDNAETLCKIRDDVIKENSLNQLEVDHYIQEMLDGLYKKDIDVPKINFDPRVNPPKLKDDEISSQRNIASINLAYNQLYGA